VQKFKVGALFLFCSCTGLKNNGEHLESAVPSRLYVPVGSPKLPESSTAKATKAPDIMTIAQTLVKDDGMLWTGEASDEAGMKTRIGLVFTEMSFHPSDQKRLPEYNGKGVVTGLYFLDFPNTSVAPNCPNPHIQVYSITGYREGKDYFFTDPIVRNKGTIRTNDGLNHIHFVKNGNEIDFSITMFFMSSQDKPIDIRRQKVKLKPVPLDKLRNLDGGAHSAENSNIFKINPS
jgi:hypothetical protein